MALLKRHSLHRPLLWYTATTGYWYLPARHIMHFLAHSLHLQSNSLAGWWKARIMVHHKWLIAFMSSNGGTGLYSKSQFQQPATSNVKKGKLIELLASWNTTKTCSIFNLTIWQKVAMALLYPSHVASPNLPYRLQSMDAHCQYRLQVYVWSLPIQALSFIMTFTDLSLQFWLDCRLSSSIHKSILQNTCKLWPGASNI